MLNQSISIVVILFLAFSAGCKKDTDTICENLLKQRTADTSLLNGEWQLEYFARTRNGRKITGQEQILYKDAKIKFEFNNGEIHSKITNILAGSYSFDNANYISVNSINITRIVPRDEEVKVLNAFNNAICFVIEDTKLIIHFQKDDDKHNVMILKK